MTSTAEQGSSRPRWRTLGLARRIGYALLPGDSFSYILHFRPREWPIMIAHTSIGFVIAIGVRAWVNGAQLSAYLTALLAWVGCLNAGTLALNSAFDNDEGDIGYLDAPPPVPRRLAVVSIALSLPTGFALAYAVCFAMSVAYSVPPVRLKAVAGADWAINIVGVGVLTPYAGWAATGAPLRPEGAWILVGFGLLFGALYPLTQLYQFEEDELRGDRTLARMLGIGPSLAVSLAAAILAFAAFWRGLVVVGSTAQGRWALMFSGAVWFAVLGVWLALHRRIHSPGHKRGMYRALVAWAVTDVAVIVAFAV